MNAVGTNTATSTSAMPISAPPTSSIVRCAASRGAMPARKCRSAFSTTTIASSTTIPIDSTRPNIDKLFSEKPNSCMTVSVPISDTGIASSGMIAVRQRCRNSTTTSTARIIASSNVSSTASTAARVNDTGLKMIS